MKRMKLRFTALALLACFSLGLTACGGNGGGSGSQTSSATEVSTETSAADASAGEAASEESSEGMTLEDYFNSEEMQAVLQAVIDSYGEQGVKAEMYAEGDNLMYNFTMEDVTLTEEEIATYSETLKESTAASADQYRQTASQAKDVVTNEEVNVVLTFMDAEGKVIYSETFSSADAVSAGE